MKIRETDAQMIPLAQLTPNTGQIEGVPANPRYISEDEYKALKKSLKEDDLTGVMPLVVVKHGEGYVVLGGNMRLRALQEDGAKDVSCIVVPENMPADKLRKIVISDNSTFGEWDFDMLANEWDADELGDWGLDPSDFETPQGNVKSVGELDVDSFDEEQTLKLKFKPEQYSFVLAKLREYGDDFSASLLLILGYKPDDYE